MIMTKTPGVLWGNPHLSIIALKEGVPLVLMKILLATATDNSPHTINRINRGCQRGFYEGVMEVQRVYGNGEGFP
jgi:hypothetical protein